MSSSKTSTRHGADSRSAAASSSALRAPNGTPGAFGTFAAYQESARSTAAIDASDGGSGEDGSTFATGRFYYTLIPGSGPWQKRGSPKVLVCTPKLFRMETMRSLFDRSGGPTVF